jgi:DNA mismatch repair protein MutS
MGGKSTFLRQNALIVLLAHCGFFVPATSAQIPVIDGIFARVGSGDVIAKNQSTFMTEMIEMANIVHNATARSCIILDELGRGTSTYDGMALAHAIVQYIVQHIGAKTLFATHYHELIALEESLPGVMNFSVSVYETDTDVVFMKKIVSGGASKSYGLDVAKIAGIPSVIVETAKKYLAVHEGGIGGEKQGDVFGI